jgi:hypothetical protein
MQQRVPIAGKIKSNIGSEFPHHSLTESGNASQNRERQHDQPDQRTNRGSAQLTHFTLLKTTVHSLYATDLAFANMFKLRTPNTKHHQT